MVNDSTIATDPLGRQVQLPRDLYIDEISLSLKTDVEDECRKIVETPSCMIEVPPNRLYYFRPIQWNYTLLVEARLENDIWLAVRCEKNPSSALVQTLLANGKFIACGSLD